MFSELISSITRCFCVDKINYPIAKRVDNDIETEPPITNSHIFLLTPNIVKQMNKMQFKKSD